MEKKAINKAQAKRRFDKYMREQYVPTGFFKFKDAYLNIISKVALLIIRFESVAGFGINVNVDALPFCAGINEEVRYLGSRITSFEAFNGGIDERSLWTFSLEEQCNLLTGILDNMIIDIKEITDIKKLYSFQLKCGMADTSYLGFLECIQIGDYDKALMYIEKRIDNHLYLLNKLQCQKVAIEVEIQAIHHTSTRRIKENNLLITNNRINEIKAYVKKLDLERVQVLNRDFSVLNKTIDENIHASCEFCKHAYAEFWP